MRAELIEKKGILVISFCIIMLVMAGAFQSVSAGEDVELPEVEFRDSELGELIFYRSSVRQFEDREVELEKVAEILWSTIGITVDGVTGPTRAAPSAGATDPLSIYLVAGQVGGLEPGVYRYLSEDESLEIVAEGDRSQELAAAALNQQAIEAAPFSIVIAADYQRTTGRYGERGRRYVEIEAGAAAQNANLMAENLGLKGVWIGAFQDNQVQEVLGGIEEPLIIMPLGYPGNNFSL